MTQDKEQTEKIITDKLTELLRRVSKNTIGREVRILNVIGDPAEKKLRSILERADDELLAELDRKEIKSWKSLCQWLEEKNDKDNRLEEAVDIIVRSRLPNKQPVEYVMEIWKQLGDRYEAQLKLKIIACSIWPGDHVAKARLVRESSLKSFKFVVESINLEKEKRSKKIKKYNQNKQA